MAKKAGNGEGSIFHRNRDDRWVCEITLGYDADGRKRVLRQAFNTRHEAADWRTKRLSEKLDGTLVVPSRQTVGKFMDEWLEKVVAHTAKPTTLQNYRDIKKSCIDPDLGTTLLTKLTPARIQALYHKLLQGKSARTVHLVHAVLRRALQTAVEWQVIPRNPADAVRRPRAERKEMAALTPEQIIRFLEAAQEERLHALYVLAVTAGLRQGELLGLRWDDVHLEAGTLTVRQTLQCIRGHLSFSTPKSRTSRRTVDLAEIAIAALRRWRKQQAEERLLVGGAWEDLGLVFTTEIGTPLNPSNIRNRSFRQLLARAGCPKIRFHDLRHSAATLMLAQGVRPKVLQEVLGHSQISVTLDVYAHVLREQKKEAAEKVDAFFAAAQRKA